MFRFQREISVAIALAGLLVLLAVAAPRFYTGDKLRAIALDSAPVLVAVVGMTLVMLARQIDISIAAQFAMCGVAAALMAKSGVAMPAVAGATMLLGAALGAVNGALVAGLGLPSIVVTLATWVIWREAMRWVREGESVRDLPGNFQWFGLGQETGQLLIVAAALTVLFAFAVALRWTAAGRAVYAVGSDPRAAFLVGVRPRLVVFVVFVTLGALTGLAALLHSARLAIVTADPKDALALEVIAAVVVGGVAISGGRGNLLGPFLGVALLATITPALAFLAAAWKEAALPGIGAPNRDSDMAENLVYWEQAIQGGIILTAIAADAFKLKWSRRAASNLATS